MRQDVRLRLGYVTQTRGIGLMHKTLRPLARVAFALLPPSMSGGCSSRRSCIISHVVLAQVTAFCQHEGWMIYCAFYDYAVLIQCTMCPRGEDPRAFWH